MTSSGYTISLAPQRPVLIDADGPLRIQNFAATSVFYGAENVTVETGTELVSDSTVTLSSSRWFVSATPTQVFVTQISPDEHLDLRLDVVESNVKASTTVPLDLPTADGNPSVTHPDVVYEPVGWNGWSYWMAYTPYPDGARENPHIAVSDNGVDWRIPDGLTNPLFDTGFEWPGHANSDTDMVLKPDKSVLVLFFRAYDGTGTEGERIYRTTSANGVRWSTPTTVLTSASGFQIVSPAFAYDDAGTTLYCWSVNQDAAKESKLERRSSTDHGETWDEPTTCTIPVVPGDKYVYHFDVQRTTGRWHALAVSNGPTTVKNYRLYHWTSTDGLVWTAPAQDAAAILPSGFAYDESGAHYRSCFVPVPGKPLSWKVWVSGIDASDSDIVEAVWRISLYDGVTFENSESLWIPANAFVSTSGSPSLSTAGARFPAWLMDFTGIEQVNASVTVPGHWRAYDGYIYWTNQAAGTGGVKWTTTVSSLAEGALLTAGDTALGPSAKDAPAQNVLVATMFSNTPVAVTAGQNIIHVRVQRRPDDGADTLGNDAAFLGIRLIRAA